VSLRRAAAIGLGFIALAGLHSAAAEPLTQTAPASGVQEILGYIKQTWRTLRRDHTQLAQAAVDDKVKSPDGHWPVYVPRTDDRAAIEAMLDAEMSPVEREHITLEPLPLTGVPTRAGLLYLPQPYVVPGGRFNEMYGWDSYFIVRGLLRDGEIELAKGMVDNFVYEVTHYGHILNANRTYYLSRSQPPFFTDMILRVFSVTHDRAWLEGTLPAVLATYRYFTSPPHVTPQTGLSRYHDLGRGPAEEVLTGEKDASGLNHYDRVRAYLRGHEIADYDLTRFYDRAGDRLTDLFYLADRSMRESGFDPSERFGPFNLGVLDYDPVCLNSLLYLMEKQTAEILTTLGQTQEAASFRTRARARGEQIEALLWDHKSATYLDYDAVKHKRRPYLFATTFFPLWVGLASESHAKKLVAHALRRLERQGGLVTSEHISGNQWDAPFGWAPLELIAVEGLRRYGFDGEADRIAVRFLNVVLKEFVARGTIFEKYDVVRSDADTTSEVKFGYRSNEVGFGWTNAVFIELYAGLSPAARAEVRAATPRSATPTSR
jgi:alpha,alpha-trehalase